MAEKTQAELLKEKLFYEPKNAYETLSEEEIQAAEAFCEGYKAFLDEAKMEREAVRFAVRILEEKGFRPHEAGKHYQPGDRVYYNNRGKALCAAVIGTRPLAEGVRILASHIDSPRVDLKPRPLYEEAELGYFKTHYYGGIKKYQWAALPLSLHGVIVLRDGTRVDVTLGDQPDEPVFCITDLLPHLAAEQSKRPLAQGLRGEELNILIGSRPFKDDKASEKVKLAIAKLLFDKYGVTEADFLSAELCGLPAFPARDVGFDRSLIGAYGHDDRVCAYTSLMGALQVENPETTWVVVFADKEEVGSEGNTGLHSSFLKYFIADLARESGVAPRIVLSRSQCLSADVNAAFDPTFADVYEKRNSCFVNYGVVVTKYTGARGKSSTNDASAEFMGKVRSIFDEAGVAWQVGELGKVDAGGGGTVAMYVSALDVDTVDIGVPVLSMHAPFEVVSKLDVYSTYKAFEAFCRAPKK
ncbi:MAG: aminopeptidase [Provencibacterium sp.]|jgi:aspartyl aminopeptidase|nr:aminopeptidase [Provencibacterium sp.]